MIVKIKLANYRSIHAEQTLSFVAERGPRHPQNLIKRPGYRLLKAAALFGANASGKSNFVRAIGEMRNFVRDSATKMNDGDPITCAQPHRLDPDSRTAPSRFEITFVTDSVQYVYGFAATHERVVEEWLKATQEKSEAKLFDITRKPSDKNDMGLWEASGFSETPTHLLTSRTRPNALFLSTAARENVKELLPAFRFLRDNVNTHDMSGGDDNLYAQALERCKEDTGLRHQLSLLLRDADTGISDIGLEVTQRETRSTDNHLLWSIVASYSMAAPVFVPSEKLPRIYTSRQDTSGKSVEFDMRQDESRGTNRLFASAVFMLDALEHGAFLVIDELDASMHPLLTRRLLEMFQSEEANPNGAQLLFTTHDAVLLDSVLFRRDQIVLAEKCDNESQFYSLADVVPPPRNVEVFLRNYLAGRYGGTPHLGPAFDMLTTRSKA